MARSSFRTLAVPNAPGSPVVRALGRGLLINLLVSLRPGQWTKNLLVFAALIFAVKLFDPAAVLASIAAFVIFCALSGVVYLVNDVADRHVDQQHPLKSRRPIAAGAVSVPVALGTAALLATVS